MLASAANIFLSVILPILVIVVLGAGLQRALPLHVPTLSRLNIYLLVPAFLFVRVYDSTLSWHEIGRIAGVVMLPCVLLGLPIWLTLRARHATGTTIAAMVVGGLVFNAGNFGLPLTELFYGSPDVQGLHIEQHPGDGVAIQALIIMVTNLSVWGLGYMIMALAKGTGVRGAASYFKLPTLYVLIAAFVLRDTGTKLPTLIEFPLRKMADATVPVMMVTLGAQLAQRARWPNWRLVAPAMAIKLVALPALTALIVWLLGLWPWPGAQIVIASAAPTAVNTLLLTLELDGDADLAADVVFWTTLASAVTVTAVLSLVTALAK
jgi:malate permease and related proteins